jgi:hypothetical protein
MAASYDLPARRFATTLVVSSIFTTTPNPCFIDAATVGGNPLSRKSLAPDNACATLSLNIPFSLSGTKEPLTIL